LGSRRHFFSQSSFTKRGQQYVLFTLRSANNSMSNSNVSAIYWYGFLLLL
jgi:hypothetical protein